jgi:hypothetical protein
MFVLMFLVVSLLLQSSVDAFSISMSDRTFGSLRRPPPSIPPFGSATPLLRPPLFTPPVVPGKLSSEVISQMATLAIKNRLSRHNDVSVEISNPADLLLLQGRVGPATVKGTGWRTSRGLSCREVEASVERCQLDVSRMLSERKIALTRPAQGKALVTLDATDFANLITHPRVNLAGGNIRFLKEGVKIDSRTGAVTFFATDALSSNSNKWKCQLNKSAENKVVIQVSAGDSQKQNHDSSAGLAFSITDVTLDLGGVAVNLTDFSCAKGGTVRLAFNLQIQRFPEYT